MIDHDHTSRLRIMADADSDYDLSDNDRAAVAWAVDEIDRLRVGLGMVSQLLCDRVPSMIAQAVLDGADVLDDETALKVCEGKWKRSPVSPEERKQAMPRIGGKPFRCECGCNVFTVLAPLRYECNGCRMKYTGELL